MTTSPSRRCGCQGCSLAEVTIRQGIEPLLRARSAVSQHLKILKDAGLVEDTAAGTRRIYRLNPAALAALRDQLDTYWQRALAGYAEAAEAPTEEGQ